MNKGYDILRNSEHGTPVLITTVATRGQVEQALQALEWIEAGNYFTRETATGEIVQGLCSAAPSEIQKG